MPQATNFFQAPVYVRNDAEDLANVVRCLAGDHAAFRNLVDRYHRPFFTFALRVLGNREEASDAVQAAFVKVYENLGTFDQGRRFFSWAYRILVNESLNVRRAQWPSEPIDPNLVADSSSPLEDVERKERRHQVQAAILQLPVEYRDVIVLHYFSGLAYEEISDTLGVPQKTVKSRLYTARQRLAAALLAETTR
jgi:RNA polymerase sigma-70 factor (ECF subfamily)